MRPGDRVNMMGNHASPICVDVWRSLCVPVPLDLPGGGFDDRPGNDHRVCGRFGGGGAEPSPEPGGPDLPDKRRARVDPFDLSRRRCAVAERARIKSVNDGGALGALSQRHRLVVKATRSARAFATSIDMAVPAGEIVMIGAPWGGLSLRAIEPDAALALLPVSPLAAAQSSFLASTK